MRTLPSWLLLSCSLVIPAAAQAVPPLPRPPLPRPPLPHPRVVVPPVPLPPRIVLPAPPSVVVIPETDVYVAPELEEDVYFNDGWWWREWDGRWYRSRSYDGGWVHYSGLPYFYRRVPRGWREDYHSHRWSGGSWDYRPIPHHELSRNWRHWQQTRHWQRRENWQHRHDDRRFEARERRDARRDRHERRSDARERRRDERRDRDERGRGRHAHDRDR